MSTLPLAHGRSLHATCSCSQGYLAINVVAPEVISPDLMAAIHHTQLMWEKAHDGPEHTVNVVKNDMPLLHKNKGLTNS